MTDINGIILKKRKIITTLTRSENYILAIFYEATMKLSVKRRMCRITVKSETNLIFKLIFSMSFIINYACLTLFPDRFNLASAGLTSCKHSNA